MEDSGNSRICSTVHYLWSFTLENDTVHESSPGSSSTHKSHKSITRNPFYYRVLVSSPQFVPISWTTFYREGLYRELRVGEELSVNALYKYLRHSSRRDLSSALPQNLPDWSRCLRRSKPHLHSLFWFSKTWPFLPLLFRPHRPYSLLTSVPGQTSDGPPTEHILTFPFLIPLSRLYFL